MDLGADEAKLAPDLTTRLHAVAQSYVVEHPAEQLAWDWGEGVLAFGFERAFQATGAEGYRAYLRTYLTAHAKAGIEVAWSDDTTPALAALERVRAGDREFQPLVAQVVHYVQHAPRTPRNGVLLHLGRTPWRHLFPDAWVDSLFHVVPTLIRYSRLTGDPSYRNEAVRQLLLFLRALQDPATGLCAHAFDDRPVAHRVPSFDSRLFWARGNGWMLVALVEALVELPPEHGARSELLRGARQLEASLRWHQARGGLFHTLLLDRASYLETAGSALILYAMARGVRHQLFGTAARDAALRGARGLLSILRRRSGLTVVPGTSLGTNPIASSYRTTATAEQVSYGVGAWLMAISEIMILEKQATRRRDWVLPQARNRRLDATRPRRR